MSQFIQPWKEAATLILTAKTSDLPKFTGSLEKNLISSSIKGQDKDLDQLRQTTNDTDKSLFREKKIIESINETDYRLMMVKRSSLSSFMANAYVFPGGQFEEIDFSSKWWSIFEKANISKEKILSVSTRIHGMRPPIIKSSYTLVNYLADKKNEENYVLPLDVAFRITAIRETFEETGVLLLTNNENDQLKPISDEDDLKVNLSNWREEVRKNSEKFLDLCSLLNKCPDIWSLYEWSNWLTPISVGHKRFDTLFYICCLETIPRVVIDNREVTNLKWVTPLEMLEDHTQERLFLAPPQVYELSKFYHHKNYNEFKTFVINREKNGCERWLPVIGTYIDGAISSLPGDEIYPELPDLIGKKPVQDFSKRLNETYTSGSKLNRIELRGPTSVALSNIEPTLGHLAPISYYRNNEEFIKKNSKL